jgi:uncharacterized membrane protein
LNIFVIYSFQGKNAIWITAITTTIVVALFSTFLFSMASDIAHRKYSIVLIFIFVNIVSIIALFGNLFRWIGIKDTVRTTNSMCPLLDSIYFR